MTRILYTTGRNDRIAAAAAAGCDSRLELACCIAIEGNLGPATVGIRSLITGKCQTNGPFVQRLIDLDRELERQYADVGARGEPGVQDFRWVAKNEKST